MTILDLVLERAMTVTELAARLGRPKGSVAYHVKVLLEAGLLQVVRTQQGAGDRGALLREGRPHDRLRALAGRDPVPRRTWSPRSTSSSPRSWSRGASPTAAPGSPRERAEEYVERLYQITLEFIDEPREGDFEYGMYVGVFPTNRHIAPPAEEMP